MSDSLKKLLALSSRMKMPVVAYDTEADQSAVVMPLEEYEKLQKSVQEGCRCDCEEGEDDFEVDPSFFSSFASEEEGFSSKDQKSSSQDFHHSMSFDESEDQVSDFSSFSEEPEWIHSLPPHEEEKKVGKDESFYPAFSPAVPDEENDEEPIFFEEPV